MRFHSVWFGLTSIILNTASCANQTRLVGLPTVPFVPHGSSTFDLSIINAINVDPKFSQSVDNDGETLIPPKLIDFANTFADDLRNSHEIDTLVFVRGEGSAKSIFLTIDKNGSFTDAAGRPTSEGYSIDISASGITIAGASPLGTWWGTRTLLQQIALLNKTIPYGRITDAPGWGTRGMMLDAGRQYYAPSFIKDLCAYMSYFKQNTLHLHLSDNLYNNLDVYSREQSLALYARFRLWSDAEDVSGLNLHKNESHTHDQFEDMQVACAARGVTIIPELEAPGHALVITQWKPDLGLEDLSLLNISNPDTIPTVETIWSTFIEWFHSKTVHIGADEYTGSSTEYTRFVNAMSGYLGGLNKSIRIWGTFPPNTTNGYPNKNISVQHWEFFEANPYVDFIQQNYSVINSDDWMYCVAKYSGSYPQVLTPEKTFSVPMGGAWYPYVFDTHNSSNNPAPSDPRVLGAIAALWNDYGPTTTVFSEAYYTWRQGIPAVSDKQWGGDITSSEFYSIFDTLHANIPGQNLERTIPSKSTTIIEYQLLNDTTNATASPSYNNTSAAVATIPDLSGNAYHGSTSCLRNSNGTLPLNSTCHLLTPFHSKGRNYTLTLTLRIFSVSRYSPARLIAGSDSALYMTPTLGLSATNGYYYGANATVPLNTWVDLSLIGRGNQTFVQVDGQKEVEVGTLVDVNGVSWVPAPMAIEAPVRMLGGDGCAFSGELAGFKLLSTA